MNTDKIATLKRVFEAAAGEKDGVEFWLARDLQQMLDYTQWRRFEQTIQRAMIACETAEEKVENHFAKVGKMVILGSGAKREVVDYMLTRYACYLIAQNGDPKKESIAFAQSYFALQTRKQELIEQRIKLNQRMAARKKLTNAETELSENIYEREVTNSGFGRIRSKGDQALFGGFTTRQMKEKLEVPKNRPLADFLPTVTITAKQLATEITNLNVSTNDLIGEGTITDEHVKNNTNLREYLIKSGIQPENLPPEEDIKKLERRVKKADKKLSKGDTL